MSTTITPEILRAQAAYARASGEVGEAKISLTNGQELLETAAAELDRLGGKPPADAPDRKETGEAEWRRLSAEASTLERANL